MYSFCTSELLALKFKKGQLVGRNQVLKVVEPFIVMGNRNRLHYRTKCTICQVEQVSRYDVYHPNKGCPHRCHINYSFVGKKFSTYEVLKYVGPSISGVQFECLCICGKRFNKIAKLIRRTEKTGYGHGCGCKQSSYIIKTRVKDTLQKTLFGGYYREANKRNLSFSLGYTQFCKLITQPCHYCGISYSNTYKREWCNDLSSLQYNGIDRKDNDKGYSKSNCVSACKDCNRAKRNYTYQHFLSWIERLKSHNIQ
jgi:hypothetical protein